MILCARDRVGYEVGVRCLPGAGWLAGPRKLPLTLGCVTEQHPLKYYEIEWSTKTTNVLVPEPHNVTIDTAFTPVFKAGEALPASI